MGGITGSSSVTAGAGITGNGTPASPLANDGVLTVNGAKGAVNAGTVTSVATGNGLSGGTITSSGTLALAAPLAQSIGAYAFLWNQGTSYSVGSTYSNPGGVGAGTWRCMSNTAGTGCPAWNYTLFSRVS